MTNNHLLQAIGHIDSKLVADAAPDVSQKKDTNIVWFKREVIRKSNGSKYWAQGLVAAVLILVLIGGGGGLSFYHNQVNAVASVISLDVNPSIELQVNRNETVLSCTAMNEDAAVILSDMGGGTDLEGTKMDVAVNAVVGSLLRHGYLDSISSAILISVEDNDQDRASRIREELVTVVDGILHESSSQSTVYSQNITVDTNLEALAQNNNISSGKAYLVNQVIALNNSLNFDALVALSVEELQDLIEIGAPGLPIGMDAAAQAAQEYAGTLLLSSNVVKEVDSELDEQTPHYEVELQLPGGDEFEYKYKIDAFTGDVLSGQRDIVGTSVNGNGPDAPDGQNPSSGGDGTVTDIGAEAAKAAALSNNGLSENQVSGLKVERDWDDGRLEYEVEFKFNGYEYEYTISGTTGAILNHEVDQDD